MPVSVKRFRLISLIEGISYLVLLYFVIHHKRFLGQEDAIRRPGMGLLPFARTRLPGPELKLKLKKAALVILCSLVPFAPFHFKKAQGMGIKVVSEPRPIDCCAN
jgi:hypothetical protein